MLIKSEKELQRYIGDFDALQRLTLSDTSPSGVRYCVEVMGQMVESAVAGTPVHTSWPPDVAEQQRGHCLYPMDYVIHVQAGWGVEEIAVGMWHVHPELCDVPAAAVREALEIRREIHLLAELVALDKASTVHSAATPEHVSVDASLKRKRSKRSSKPNSATRLEGGAMKILAEQSSVTEAVREARSAALLEALR